MLRVVFVMVGQEVMIVIAEEGEVLVRFVAYDVPEPSNRFADEGALTGR